jgi:hypothetical protein
MNTFSDPSAAAFGLGIAGVCMTAVAVFSKLIFRLQDKRKERDEAQLIVTPKGHRRLTILNPGKRKVTVVNMETLHLPDGKEDPLAKAHANKRLPLVELQAGSHEHINTSKYIDEYPQEFDVQLTWTDHRSKKQQVTHTIKW